MRRLIVAAALGVTLSACGGNPPGQAVSRATMGEAWPLTVESGTLRCEPPGAVVFTAGGVEYAVNGLALGQAAQKGWRDIEEIWADNPDPMLPKMDISPLINAGLALCP
jgi:hypothetical protein